MFKNSVAEAKPEGLTNALPFLRKIIRDMGHDKPHHVTYTLVELHLEKKHKGEFLACVQTPLRTDYGEPQSTELGAKQSAAYAAILYMARAKQFGRNFIASSTKKTSKALDDFNSSVNETLQRARSRSDVSALQERPRSASVSAQPTKTTDTSHTEHAFSISPSSPTKTAAHVSPRSPLRSSKKKALVKRISRRIQGNNNQEHSDSSDYENSNDDDDELLPEVSLSLNTEARSNLDALMDKYLKSDEDKEKKKTQKIKRELQWNAGLERSFSLDVGEFSIEAQKARAIHAGKAYF